MKLIEKRISYSVGRKLSDGNFGSLDVHVSESESYEIDSDIEDISAFTENKYNEIKERVDGRLIATINEAKDILN